MSDTKSMVNIVYNTKRGWGKFKVEKKCSTDQNMCIDIDYVPEQVTNKKDTWQFSLPLPNGDEDSFLALTPESNGARFTSGWEIVIPRERIYDYEIIAGGEHMDIETSNGKFHYKIPPEMEGWTLKLKGTKEANPGESEETHESDLKETDANALLQGGENVEVKEREGLSNSLDFLLFKLNEAWENSNCQELKTFLEQMEKEDKAKRSNQRLENRRLKLRRLIIRQANQLLEQAYVHLYQKKEVYSIKPIEDLRKLEVSALEQDDDEKLKLEQDREFHDKMISIFTKLRDLHTIYTLPSPYRNKIAFLPFLIEEYYEEGKVDPTYMISKVFESAKVKYQDLKKGDIITHWNEKPIHEAVEQNGEINNGGNNSARHARGLQRMTIRPLKMIIPPEAHEVKITFKKNSNSTKSVYFDWFVADEPKRPRGAVEAKDDLVQASLGIDFESEMALRIKKELFKKKYHPKIEPESNDTNNTNNNKTFKRRYLAQRELFDFCFLENEDLGRFAYFRIYSFNVNDPYYFVKQFIRIKRSPEWETNQIEGLIVDVRGNGGGLITAGEKLLQVLTTKTVEATRFQFVSSPLTLQLCQQDKDGTLGLQQWKDSIMSSINNGDMYSQGFRLEAEEKTKVEFKPNLADEETIEADINVNRYNGEVILITDALSYSTTDIFAAGFKDYEIGPILGVHEQTGGGRANVWDYGLLYEILHGELSNLPHPDFKGCDWNFKVAIRRALRMNDSENKQEPLEDQGVKSDCVHRITRRDLLEGNEDLLETAARILLGENGVCKEVETASAEERENFKTKQARW
jgi:C-terminal processing protease CtpA/Prc